MASPSYADSNALSPYGYTPTKAVGIVMLSLLVISTFTHFVQLIKYRMWFLLITVCLCAALEITGWIGRVWSSFDVSDTTPFKIQIVCLIFGPTPFLAAMFVIFGRIIRRLGTSYSRLPPKKYTIIFCSCDVVALVIQCLGGVVAASASTLDRAKLGAHIMLVGIVFQVLVICGFSTLAIEFIVRYNKNRPLPSRVRENDGPSTMGLERGVMTERIRKQLYGVLFCTGLLFVRSIYRTAELGDGWKGYIISHEVYFDIFDATMVVLAMIGLNVAHPGVLLSTTKDGPKYEMAHV